MAITGQGTLRAAIPKRGLDQVSSNVAKNIGFRIELAITLRAPVDEGRLQNSISTRDDRGGQVVVATQLEYAPYPKTIKAPGGNVSGGDYENGLPPYWYKGIQDAQRDLSEPQAEYVRSMRQYLQGEAVT